MTHNVVQGELVCVVGRKGNIVPCTLMPGVKTGTSPTHAKTQQKHMHIKTHSHTHARTSKRAHTRTRAHARKHTHTHTRTTHARTQTHTRFISVSNLLSFAAPARSVVFALDLQLIVVLH